MTKLKTENTLARIVQFRNLSVLAAWIVMPIPFVMAIDRMTNGIWMSWELTGTPSQHVIWLMLIANLLAFVFVNLWTIHITRQTDQTDKLKAVVPHRFNQTETTARWYTTLRRTWRWHLLMAVPRLGLVFGLISNVYRSCHTNLLRPIFGPYCHSGSYTTVTPSQVIFVVCLLILFGLAHLALLTAIMLYHQRQSPQRVVRRTILTFVRPLIVLAATILLFQGVFVIIFSEHLRSYINVQPHELCRYGDEYKPLSLDQLCWTDRYYQVRRHFERESIKVDRLVEHAQVMLGAMVDGGTMLTLNLMRVQQFELSQARQVLSDDNPYKFQHNFQRGISMLIDYAIRLFAVVVTMLGVMALQTRYYLRKAERVVAAPVEAVGGVSS